jgi:glycosyltransferase involved in cell wall biosynthesis
MSKAAAEEIAVSGFPRKRIRRFEYWVDLSRFQPIDKGHCKEIVGVEDRFLVLYVGRLIHGKGISTILDVAKMFEKNNNVRFGIVGTGILSSEIERYRDTHSNLTFFGPIPNKHLPLYYNSADLVLVPSIHEEGFPRVIVESLSCGTPVLASNTGSIPEALDETVGVICNPDSASIASKLHFLLNNNRALGSLAQHSRDFSLRRFGFKNAKLIEQAYDFALSPNSYAQK